MIGSCSAVANFLTGDFPVLCGAVLRFASGELGLFFLETPAAVAAVDRVGAFVLIAFIAGGVLDDRTGVVFVRAEARVAGADAFARPAMIN